VAIYTDGSKDPRTGHIGSAFVVQESGVAVRKPITDHLAVYMMELMGVLLALQWLEGKLDRVVTCSDSCAVLMSLQSFSSRSRQDLLYEVLQTHGRVRQIGMQTSFLGSQPMWGWRGTR
jgi:ribonuclease HI